MSPVLPNEERISFASNCFGGKKRNVCLRCSNPLYMSKTKDHSSANLQNYCIHYITAVCLHTFYTALNFAWRYTSVWLSNFNTDGLDIDICIIKER